MKTSTFWITSSAALTAWAFLAAMPLIAQPTQSSTALDVVSTESDDWSVTDEGDYVVAQVYGTITKGDKHRFVFRKSDCDHVGEYFSVYSQRDNDFSTLVGKTIVIKFNDDIIGAMVKLIHEPAFGGHLVVLNLGAYQRQGFLDHITKGDTISIKMVDGNGFKAADYFDVLKNEWPVAAIKASFASAYDTCLNARTEIPSNRVTAHTPLRTRRTSWQDSHQY